MLIIPYAIFSLGLTPMVVSLLAKDSPDSW